MDKSTSSTLESSHCDSERLHYGKSGSDPTHWKTPLFFAILVLSITAIAAPHTVRANTTDLLYVYPANTSLVSVGTKFNVTVNVANFESFIGWDIHVKSNSSIINPLNVSISSNMFVVNSTGGPPPGGELANCVNGSGPGTSCSDGLEGKGVVRSAAAYIGLDQGSGLLFTITYNATGIGYSDITISATQITNGNGVISPNITSGSYGNKIAKPDFTIETTPANVVLTLAQSHNVSQTTTVAISSLDSLSGQAHLSASSTLSTSLNPIVLFLPANGTVYSTMTVSATNKTQSTQYFVTLNCTVANVTHSILLQVRVNPIPDFIMSVTPSILKIHATNSGSSSITLDTQSGFSGSIHLKMDIPQVSGLIASLGAADFSISPGQPATTVFAVRTPPSDFPFKYLINITASSAQSSTHIPFTITVRSPSSDFGFQISGTGFVLQAGQSRTFTLNATSIDYFRGQIFFLAFSLSGMKESFTKPSVELEYGNSSITQVTLIVDPFIAPGNHFMNLTALGTTFLGTNVNHTIIETITVVPPPITATILGIQPAVYFGVIGTLWVGVVGAAAREIRKPKPRRFLT